MNKKYVLHRCFNVIDISFGRVFIPLNHPSCVYRPWTFLTGLVHALWKRSSFQGTCCIHPPWGTEWRLVSPHQSKWSGASVKRWRTRDQWIRGHNWLRRQKMFWRLVIGYMSADDRINWFQILSFSNVLYGFDCIMVFFLIKICSYLSQKIGYDLYRSLCQFGRRQIDDIFLVLKNFFLFVRENRLWHSIQVVTEETICIKCQSLFSEKLIGEKIF